MGSKFTSGFGFPESPVNLRSSYDDEVYVVLIGPEEILTLQKVRPIIGKITVIIDNKSVVEQISKIISKIPFHFLNNEWDMYNGINKLVIKIENKLKIVWKPSHTNEISLPELLNGRVDNLDQIHHGYQHIPRINDISPYSQSAASVWINKMPIPSNIVNYIKKHQAISMSEVPLDRRAVSIHRFKE